MMLLVINLVTQCALVATASMLLRPHHLIVRRELKSVACTDLIWLIWTKWPPRKDGVVVDTIATGEIRFHFFFLIIFLLDFGYDVIVCHQGINSSSICWGDDS